MKIRGGFVSNSSSSSFIVNKQFLTLSQIKMIRSHKVKGPYFGFACSDFDEWQIKENEYVIAGHTDMDNFPMFSFMAEIGIDLDVVQRADDAWSMFFELREGVL